MLLAVLIGCSDGPTEPPTEPDVRHIVTGEAAENVDNHGHFTYTAFAPASHFTAIDSARAALLAPALIRTFAWPAQGPGTPLGERLEQQHGASIDLAAIHTGDVMLATSPYLDPAASVPVWARNLAAPKFIARLRQGAMPTITLGIAAYAADVELVGDKVTLPQESGNEFAAIGNPRSQGLLHPISAERAAVAAAKATGALIAGVPVFVLPNRIFGFDLGRWEVVLDREVTFRRPSGATSTSNVIYVGIELTSNGSLVRHDGVFLPSAIQPSEDTISTNPIIVLTRRPGVPLSFETVVAIQ